MTKEQFVDAIRAEVRRAAIFSAVSRLRSPAGRKPRSDVVAASAWFNELSEEDRRMVEWVVTDAVDGALFHFLCVLDGVKPIDDGELRLYHEKGGSRTLLNDIHSGEFLHDLYNAA